MDKLELLIDLHKNACRQGPGGEAETQKMIDLALLDSSSPLKIADIGCGTGASSIQLAKSLNADISAVDFLPEFITVLEQRLAKHGVSEKIKPLVASMDALPFAEGEFDVIWSEGAIYNMGFEAGINYWRRFLKPNGILVVSEITWLTQSRPQQIEQHWNNEYPEIATAGEKTLLLEKAGYAPQAYFVLPEQCWTKNYYQPMQNSFNDFLQRNNNSEDAKAIVVTEAAEIALYEKFKAYYSYGVYIAKKVA